jgi:hypothetical protein
VNCRHCGQEFTFLAGQKFCSFCGGSLDHVNNLQEAALGDNVSADQIGAGQDKIPFSHQDTGYCPWEDQENLGFIQGMCLTLKQSLFTPTRFFSILPKHTGLTNPLLYALIIGTLGAMAGYLIGTIVENPFFSQSKLSGPITILIAVLVPVFVFFGVLLGTIFLHISLFLVGGLNENFESTFRVVCYSSGPDIFNAIPVVGWLVVLVWKLVVTVIGVREVQQIGTGRATVAVLLPAIVCCGLSFAGVLAIISVGSGLV